MSKRRHDTEAKSQNNGFACSALKYVYVVLEKILRN